MIDFEWDLDKEKKNIRKHHVAFNETATVLKDIMGITIYDPDHSDDEDRFITIGAAITGRLQMVSHTYKNDETRIISARELTRKEREAYENEIQRRKS
ncbi:MAG: BrnT family toxin [Syntrophales bacterium]